jgi:hypothetical protein
MSTSKSSHGRPSLNIHHPQNESFYILEGIKDVIHISCTTAIAETITATPHKCAGAPPGRTLIML